jgi:hypothetical protein
MGSPRSSPICAAASLLVTRALLVVVCAAAVLFAGGAASAAPDPACVGLEFKIPPCADLVPGRLTAQVIEDGRRLRLTTQVSNSGSADAPESMLQVTIGKETLAPEKLAAVHVKGSVPVDLKDAIPKDVRGSGQPVTLTVDSANTVPESEESNNVARTKAFLPALPDLVIESATVEVAKGGTAVAVQATVDNKGTADSVSTTVKVAANGLSSTSTLPTLAAGASSTVQMKLDVPEQARVGPVTVTLTVDPDDLVAEADENNDFTPKPVTIAPDLLIASVDHTVRDHSLKLTVRIKNGGDAGAAATQLHASAPGWDPGTAPVAALAAGAVTSVKVSLTVPRASRGRRVAIAVAVDPVPGDPHDNNVTSVRVPIPKLPITRPDIDVSGLRLRFADDELHVHGVVANVGGATAANVRLELFARGWPSRERTLESLRAGATTPVDFVLPVAKAERGHRAAFRLRARPARNERVLANNETAGQVTLPALPPAPASHHRSRTALIGSVGGSLLAVCIGFGFALRSRRLRVRARWQEEAEDERPEICQVPQAHVLRGECKLKPALRRIEKLELTSGGKDGHEQRKSLDGGIVETLNRAVWAHRLRRHRRVRALVAPLGERLAGEIEQWLTQTDGSEVAITAHIKGGKVECEFKRSECVREGDSCRWNESQEWKGEAEHEVEQPVAAVHIPLEPRPERVLQLSSDLAALVGRVDIPRRLRAPETAAPLPRS